jgi:hypothetical protein
MRAAFTAEAITRASAADGWSDRNDHGSDRATTHNNRVDMLDRG